ncbi:MAG: GNAT family N-acetyltransferase [Anaerolineae bacterium]|nr:GNAT family N-acetyltransferase [Anaerolineae bacterium]
MIAPGTGSLYTIRSATLSDCVAIRHLLSHSRRIYLPAGFQWLEQRLAAGDCWVMVEGRHEIAGVLAVLRRHPQVISIVGAAVRNGIPASLYVGKALPLLEAYGRRQRACGLACLGSAAWLSETLSAQGFLACEHIITYGWHAGPLPVTGNRAVTVEPVRHHELEAIAAIDRQIFAPVWHKPQDELEFALGRADYFVVAKYQEHIVGYCWSEWDGTRGHLTRLGVAEEWQGKGIGTRLLTEALVAMVRAGVTWVTLNTQLSNEPARRLYERYGFRNLGQAVPLLWKDLEKTSPSLDTSATFEVT